ncbi:hypothetical protein A3J90_02035 [candidate division WOR-1 bacterium RIFOXYC2_FULL_37_10]|uniref:SpoVT-AbrB domain-containing protein n=1 Tax=candidate division WOR-1 bacterium RIFOXYB2_FULL_37_13 TaxID=1802579 RepID=A0A1F4SU76_UNCSA|nr:MAG: hypothetical protein A2246_03620 [candidate division WOR-1 bacterium RIFOXYA2_FULL_37_7]OGC23990.1 MAG: hypothetical protein A2310_05535 [candidate division WOR-1 bacterium RIFOXYB2_FULL_37_13]OGC33929.1 MAG: hypothetical protein A3J90_02035 [candidate division WOR-1 bacterium RIFOXYC2_FULL_37_10]
MKAIKYFTSVLPDGNIPIPKYVRREMPVKKGEELEVILSYITIKNKEDSIKSLQKRMQEDSKAKVKKHLTLKEINEMVHEIRRI